MYIAAIERATKILGINHPVIDALRNIANQLSPNSSGPSSAGPLVFGAQAYDSLNPVEHELPPGFSLQMFPARSGTGAYISKAGTFTSFIVATQRVDPANAGITLRWRLLVNGGTVATVDVPADSTGSAQAAAFSRAVSPGDLVQVTVQPVGVALNGPNFFQSATAA